MHDATYGDAAHVELDLEDAGGDWPLPILSRWLSPKQRLKTSNLAKVCQEVASTIYSPAKGLIGEINSDNNVDETFHWETGADSTKSVGYSESGDYGGYTQQGTKKLYNSNGIDFAKNTLSKRYQTKIRYRKYYTHCYDYATGYSYNTNYQLRPYQWYGDDYSYTVSRPSSSHYANASNGSTRWRSSGSAVTWRWAAVSSVSRKPQSRVTTPISKSSTSSTPAARCVEVPRAGSEAPLEYELTIDA